jgi:hypothetical protein
MPSLLTKQGKYIALSPTIKTRLFLPRACLSNFADLPAVVVYVWSLTESRVLLSSRIQNFLDTILTFIFIRVIFVKQFVRITRGAARRELEKGGRGK